MQAPAGRILRVALPVPLRRTFDYFAPVGEGAGPARPGSRVAVPFGRGALVGIVLELDDRSELAPERLRTATAVLDAEPLLSAADLALLTWASRYYQHPIGEVVTTALPTLLRSPRAADMDLDVAWRPIPAAATARVGPRQRRLLEALALHPEGLSTGQLQEAVGEAAESLRALHRRGLVERVVRPRVEPAAPAGAAEPPPALTAAQDAALRAIRAEPERFAPLLLEGVTGSGKTEVYLRAIEDCVAAGRQALVLVPEIGLTGQTVERFRARLRQPLVLYHSGLGELERARAWLAARAGAASVVLGTRSAVWLPLPRLGLLVVDEEHDPSYKQQEGFRYNARDLAVVRAQRAQAPVVLGSATPSLESLQNVAQGRYRHARLPERAGAATLPAIEILDLRDQPLREGLSLPLLEAVERCLATGGQALLFVNRRGWSPLLLCHGCGWSAQCPHCDTRLILHAARAELRCHHCDYRRAAIERCPDCGAQSLLRIGQGTERVEQALRQRFRAARVLRIDSDTTARRGTLEEMLEAVGRGEVDILVGTQMLSKGHHFPRVTLVGVVDTDSRLYSVDFRAPERLAQLITQVAGRAGRAGAPGRVLLQTHFPEHPLLLNLVREGYAAFARGALAERRQAQLPPFSAMALLRAEASQEPHWRAFLEAACALAANPPRVQVLGPAPAPMPRRAGRHRGQVLLVGVNRGGLQAFLEAWLPAIEQLVQARRVRWTVDVDPYELY